MTETPCIDTVPNMAKRQRRQSQNSRIMRQILDSLREYDVDEVRLLCDKWRSKQSFRGNARRPARGEKTGGNFEAE